MKVDNGYVRAEHDTDAATIALIASWTRNLICDQRNRGNTTHIKIRHLMNAKIIFSLFLQNSDDPTDFEGGFCHLDEVREALSHLAPGDVKKLLQTLKKFGTRESYPTYTGLWWHLDEHEMLRPTQALIDYDRFKSTTLKRFDRELFDIFGESDFGDFRQKLIIFQAQQCQMFLASGATTLRAYGAVSYMVLRQMLGANWVKIADIAEWLDLDTTRCTDTLQPFFAYDTKVGPAIESRRSNDRRKTEVRMYLRDEFATIFKELTLANNAMFETPDDFSVASFGIANATRIVRPPLRTVATPVLSIVKKNRAI